MLVKKNNHKASLENLGPIFICFFLCQGHIDYMHTHIYNVQLRHEQKPPVQKSVLGVQK